MAARRSSSAQQPPAAYAPPPGYMVISEENFARLTAAASQATAQTGLNVERHYTGLTLAQESMAKTIASFEVVSAEKDKRISALQTQVAERDQEISRLKAERADVAREAQRDEAALRKMALELEERRRTLEGGFGFLKGPGKDLALLLLAPEQFANVAVMGALGSGAASGEPSTPNAPPPEVPISTVQVQEWREALMDVFLALSEETTAHLRSQFGAAFRAAAQSGQSPLRGLAGKIFADAGPARVERLLQHTVAVCDPK